MKKPITFLVDVVATMFAVVFSIPSAVAAEVSARQVQPGKFEFVLTNSKALSESEAMALIAKAAASTCKGNTPVLGKYKYEAKEAIGGTDPATRDPDAFRFVQEVSCVVGPPVQTAERRPLLKNEEESRQVQNEVKLKSEAYFRLIASKQFDEALAQVALEGMGLTDARWKSSKVSFQALAGEPLEILISKITLYDNPVAAPEPGLYVAADYANAYRNVPIHCGYLMWFRPIGGEFRITREEAGHVTAEQLKTIPSAQLPEIKRSLRCPAP